MSAPRPYNLVAELTYRCPLRCPYCSNPVNYGAIRDDLDASSWTRIFDEAAKLGVIHVGLTGGEPSARTDLEEIVRGASNAGLYTHLVTSGRPITAERLEDLKREGLRSVQLSFQDSLEAESDRIAGTRSFSHKRAIASKARELDLALVINVVLHRSNLERTPQIIELARELDAERLELANVQLHGWARENRGALLPTLEQLNKAAAVVEEARRQSTRPEILFVLPDHWSDRPKPCMGGWGRKTIVIAPDGLVTPCHEARTLPNLEFWNAGKRSLLECWAHAPGMNAYRGESWMREPCRSCDLRATDFGGCRCQAFHLAGEAAEADPACELAPSRSAMLRARSEAGEASGGWIYRGA